MHTVRVIKKSKHVINRKDADPEHSGQYDDRIRNMC